MSKPWKRTPQESHILIIDDQDFPDRFVPDEMFGNMQKSYTVVEQSVSVPCFNAESADQQGIALAIN